MFEESCNSGFFSEQLVFAFAMFYCTVSYDHEDSIKAKNILNVDFLWFENIPWSCFPFKEKYYSKFLQQFIFILFGSYFSISSRVSSVKGLA